MSQLATKQQQQAISTTKLFVQIQYVLLDHLQKQKVQFTTVVSKAAKLSPKTNSKSMGGILQSSSDLDAMLSWFTVCRVEQGQQEYLHHLQIDPYRCETLSSQ